MSHKNDDFLIHFGIFGMKWGIRRFQNPDGTLTEEGRKRYGYKDTEVEKSFVETMNKNPETVKRIKENGPKIVQMGNDISKRLDKAYETVKLSDKQKEKMWNELHNEWGEGPADREIYDYVLENEIAEKYLQDAFPKKIKDDIAKMDKMSEQYWNDIHSLSNPVIDQYKNYKITDSNGRETSADFLINTSGSGRDSYLSKYFSDISFNAYFLRNFNDYWIHDEEYYKALGRICEDFSVEEYEKRFG